jgi:hypothetical protein
LVLLAAIAFSKRSTGTLEAAKADIDAALPTGGPAAGSPASTDDAVVRS